MGSRRHFYDIPVGGVGKKKATEVMHGDYCPMAVCTDPAIISHPTAATGGRRRCGAGGQAPLRPPVAMVVGG